MPSELNIADYVRAIKPHSNPAKFDSDDDGISDDEEEDFGTLLMNADTDGDDLNDGLEVINWYDPLNPNPDNDEYDDYEEFNNGTDPYKKDITADEWKEQFIEGLVDGDLIDDPTIPQLIGQISGSIAPGIGTLADIRDTIVNVAKGNWFSAILSATGIVPLAGGAVKASSKAVEFITNNINKTDEIADLIIHISKEFPDDFAKLIPSSSLDEIAEAFKKSDRMSRKTYDEVAAIFAKAGKKLPTIADDVPDAKKVIANTDIWGELPTKRGFAIDELLGNNLGRTYKTYDHFDDTSKIATSFKSIDPMCKSYQTPSKFKGVLNKYANDLLAGANKVIYKGNPYEIKKKCLNLVFPDVPLTKAQKEVLDEFIKKHSSEFDIVITIVQ